MKVHISKLKRTVKTLKELIDEAESAGIDEVRTTCNTYGLTNFISYGSDGFLDLDANMSDLLDED